MNQLPVLKMTRFKSATLGSDRISKYCSNSQEALNSMKGKLKAFDKTQALQREKSSSANILILV